MRTLITALSLITLVSSADAQIRKPPLSPRSVVTQQIGLGEMTIDYGRPSVRGRKIFGELEAFGVVWRTGANACTTVTFGEDAEVGGQQVKAGKYGLYTIPRADEWTIILSSQNDLWGAGGYDPASDVARFDVEVETLGAVHETLSIEMQGFHANGADMTIAWERTRVRFPVRVDADTRVLQEIDEKVRKAKGEVSPRTYFDAGMYLYEKRENLEEAEAWIDRAVELQPAAWWQIYYKAELAHHLGKHEKAMAAARAALEGAEASPQGDFGYAARTRALIARIARDISGDDR